MASCRGLGVWFGCLLVACGGGGGGDVRPDVVGDVSSDVAGDAEVGSEVSTSLAPYVRPHIGTGGRGWYAGNSFVGAALPFGMVQAGPQTRLGDDPPMPWHHCSGYHHDDDQVTAFAHTHFHGTGIPELGSVGFMAMAGGAEALPETGLPWSHYDRDEESARPGYYAMTLSDLGARVELTATERAAVWRVTPTAGADRVTFVVDADSTIVLGDVLDGGIEVQPEAGTIEAWDKVQNEFSRPFGGFRTFVVARTDAPVLAHGQDARRAWLTVQAPGGQPVELRVGVSFVSAAGARANLDAEVGLADFQTVLDRAEQRWSDQLDFIHCDGMTDTQRTVLATSAYHTFLMPTLWSDADGTWLGFDDALHTDAATPRYTSFSLWDTYRTVHPLLVLIEPDRQRDFVRSLIGMADEGGWLPKWPTANGYSNIMIGAPADIVIADTWLKGVRDFDVERALGHIEHMAENAVPPEVNYEGRAGVELYNALGYVPLDDGPGESVSSTLEMAIADAADANLAEALGKVELAARFRTRSESWKNLYDPETGVFRPRLSDGSWLANFDVHATAVQGQAFTEGNALQYAFLVPQDVTGLAELSGGAEELVRKLQEFFEPAVDEQAELRATTAEDFYWLTHFPRYYWHGNEPDIHAAWMFSELGRPDLTAAWVRWIMDTHYGDGPDGIPGNDDSGTLGAWYLFAALGLYPNAGSTEYWLGAPAFSRCELRLGGGETLVVEADAAALADGPARVLVDGQPLDGFVLDHDAIAHGATLRFEGPPTTP
ncbi:MAG: glycoside hydrolase family 92 protein [Deltaproteobacteria bacterium]|nr:glycoside hydrolase family 92 protein [Deltaproteobacteria bacterium]